MVYRYRIYQQFNGVMSRVIVMPNKGPNSFKSINEATLAINNLKTGNSQFCVVDSDTGLIKSITHLVG
jgi:hypothetical protein